MNGNSESLRKLNAPLGKSLEEMSQQTLDALKVVHSFESKPARSERIQRMLERNQNEESARPPLQPVRPSSSPERQPRSLQGAKQYFDLAPQPESDRENSLSKLGNSYTNSSYLKQPAVSRDLPHGLKYSQTSALPKPSLARAANPHASTGGVNTAKHSITKNSSKALPALRTKGSSLTFSNTSRLLQPTAASVAKVNPKILPRPASKGPMNSLSSHFGQQTAVLSKSKPSVPEHTAKVGAPRPGYLTKPAQEMKPSSSFYTTKNITRTKLPQLKPLAAPTPKPVTLTTTPVSKIGSQFHGQFVPNDMATTINPSLLSLDSVANNPAKTSTPVRPLLSVTEEDRSSLHNSSIHSLDYSNFSNFSYVADWAKTPELAKKALEQERVDPMKLFGAIPPVDIEAIFGAEIKRQKRDL